MTQITFKYYKLYKISFESQLQNIIIDYIILKETAIKKKVCENVSLLLLYLSI